MSLQGTLNTFALSDVLRLLATTGKTGRLHIDAARGSGDVWVDAGLIVAAEADSAEPTASLAEVTFELLRDLDGSFYFDADMTTSNAGTALEVEPLLGEAEELLAEWREIEAVVPSMTAWVALAPELPRAQATVRAEQWRVLVAIGSGTTVHELRAVLELGELPAGRAVKDLVEAGLVVVDVEGAPEQSDQSWERDDDWQLSVRGARAPEDDGADAAEELAALAEASKADAPELALQLAKLGPAAAQAVAAAAQAATPEEREAALATLDGDTDGEPINRGLLLKFLSSVRS